MDILQIYIPIAAALISLISAIVVALMSIFNLRRIESIKSKENYYNFKLKQIMDEYSKYDPIFDFSATEAKDFVKIYEMKFKECRASLLRLRPLIANDLLIEIDRIEDKYNTIIRNQYNAQLSGSEPGIVDAQEYTKMINDYVMNGHQLLQAEIEKIRKRFEGV